MPVKTKTHRPHHAAHKREKRSKHFLKVYAPYIPLLLIVATGITLSFSNELRHVSGQVKYYATNTSPQGLLEETNKRRQAEGLASLSASPALQKAAQAKAEDMKARNYWSHTTPDGKEPWSFIEAANYSYRKAAENLAYGFDNSSSTLNGWMNNPGHRANVLDSDLKEVGFGIANVPNYQDKGPETIVVAMYGQPAALEATTPQPTEHSAAPKPVVAAVQPAKVSYIQAITAGKAPWITFVSGLAIGAILTYLIVTHIRSIRRTLRSSEKFVIKHPLFDMTLVALMALLVIVSQNIGSIY